jgi:hypothetical protein
VGVLEVAAQLLERDVHHEHVGVPGEAQHLEVATPAAGEVGAVGQVGSAAGQVVAGSGEPVWLPGVPAPEPFDRELIAAALARGQRT